MQHHHIVTPCPGQPRDMSDFLRFGGDQYALRMRRDGLWYRHGAAAGHADAVGLAADLDGDDGAVLVHGNG